MANQSCRLTGGKPVVVVAGEQVLKNPKNGCAESGAASHPLPAARKGFAK